MTADPGDGGAVNRLENTRAGFVARYWRDYLKNALEAVPDGTVVRLNIGEEFPLKLTYDIGPGEHGHVEYMQAPRIQGE